MNEGGTPALVLDILETHWGTWFTIDEIVWEVQRIRPHVSEPTVRRAVWRLLDRGGVVAARAANPSSGGYIANGEALRSDYTRLAVLRRSYLEEAI